MAIDLPSLNEGLSREDTCEFLAAIVESSDDAIVAYAPAGHILSWNRGAERLLGYPAAEAIGQPYTIIVVPERREIFRQCTERVLCGEYISQRDGVAVAREGRRIPVSIACSPTRNASGEIVAVATILRDLTERRQAEQTSGLLAAIVESAEEAIFSIGPDCAVLSWNCGAEALFGYSAAQAIGASVALIAQPERLAELSRSLEALRGGSPVAAFETVWQTRDGAPVDLLISLSPLRNAEGEIAGASIIARDIRARLRAERELRASEERFRSVFEHAALGISVASIDGRFLQVNEALCRMLGYTADELIGCTWARLTHPDDLASSLEMKNRLLREPNVSVEGEKRYLHRDGRIVWTRLKIAVVCDEFGTPQHFVAHFEDITQRKRAEAALRESEDRFRILADSCPIVMWVSNASGGLEFINRARRDFSGVALEEALGDKWHGYVHPDDAEEYLAVRRVAIRDHAPYRAEVRLRRYDGEWRWFAVYAEPRFSASGEFLGHVGLSPDIDDHKKTEQARQFQHSLIRAIHEVSLDGILVVDNEGFVVSHNQKFLDAFQISIPEEAIVAARAEGQLRDAPLLSAALAKVKDPEAVRARVKEIYSCCDVTDHCEIALRDGRTLERYSTNLRTEEGRSLGRIWFFRDITERQQAMRDLRESEEKFRQLAENIPEVFWIARQPGDQLIYVSPAYEQVWGRTCASLYRNPLSWADAIHPEDAACARFLFGRQIQGEPVESDYRILTPAGQERWIRDRAFPIRDSHGELVRVVGIAKDITERKHYEAELIRAREGADARSGVLEMINRHEPLGKVLGAASAFLRQHFPGCDTAIYLSTGRDELELVPESCSSPELLLRLARVAVDSAGAEPKASVCARAAFHLEPAFDTHPKPACGWPVLDSKGQLLGVITAIFRAATLPGSVREIFDLTTQLVVLAIDNRRLYDVLTHRSQHDSLTGLPNRVFLDQHLTSLIKCTGRTARGFALAYIDLDEFKDINDIYGHAVGDMFLKIAASRLRSALRANDVLARIGGDEFIAVLDGAEDRASAAVLGHRLLESLRKPFAITTSQRLLCTASIGIALFPDDGATIEDLKHSADESMYAAKTAGKNQVQAYDTVALPKNRLSAAKVRQAISESRLRVHYQPIFLAQGALSGFEALIRIQDTSGQLIAPDRFIDVAEKSSLIVPLGRCVLVEACRQAAAWERETRAGLKIAVNVSASQFAHPDFFADVLQIASDAGLPEHLLELEITEAAILKDLNGAIHQIEKLRGRGVRIALDDFGTGYSALSLLNTLPIDVLKIDRSFIQNLCWQSSGIHAVRAILSLTSALSLQSVAEGVEHDAQLQILLSLGCRAFQGFGLSRPLPASIVQSRLENWLTPVHGAAQRLSSPNTSAPLDLVTR